MTKCTMCGMEVEDMDKHMAEAHPEGGAGDTGAGGGDTGGAGGGDTGGAGGGDTGGDAGAAGGDTGGSETPAA